MTSETLQKARDYEVSQEKKIADAPRPLFHLSARVGWMNDPNGFSYFGGEYHLFYQYHPYSTVWGPMHWAHVATKDFVHWKLLPCAIAPDQPYDKDGCFSGNALDLGGGKHLLMYTSVRREQQSDGTIQDIQTQSIATGDGIDYEKCADNPVIKSDALPPWACKFDFRDPKIWREGDHFCCIAGTGDDQHDGHILLFTSKDAIHWEYKSVLAENNHRYGRIWECPDIFSIDTDKGKRDVLFVSPQDFVAKDYDFQCGDQSIYILGKYDGAAGKIIEEDVQRIDHGIDFYAAQTVLTQDGRRVMIAWMQNWDACAPNPCDPTRKWYGQMTLPRELSIKNGRLYQRPVREFDTLRKNKVEHKCVVVDGEATFEGVSGRRADLSVVLHLDSSKEECRRFTINFAQNKDHRTSINYYPAQQELSIDRRFAGSRRAFVQDCCAKVGAVDGLVKLRAILDTFSVELFINDGEKTMTVTIPTTTDATGISFESCGKAIIDVEKWDVAF